MSARCHECKRKKGPDWFLVCLRPPKSGHGENVEEWLCGRPRCYNTYNEEADVVKGEIIETVGGVEVRKKVRDTSKLQPGQYVRNGRSVVLVESVNDAGARVRGVSGRGAGTVTTWSASSAGHVFLTKEEVEAELQRVAEERAVSQDEASCENCWPNFKADEDVTDKSEMGRDPQCPNHVSSQPVVVVVRKRREAEKPEDIKRVLEFRATGMAYHKIEKEMGWPDTKGNRPYRIVKEFEKPKERAPGIRPRGRK